MTIYLDFDGTVVEHEYPKIGKYNEGAFEVIKKLQDAGHEIILNTYRANMEDGTLEEARAYLNQATAIHPIFKFEKEKIEPYPWNWEYFKEHDLIFIDDICQNSPLMSIKPSTFPIVDWKSLDKEFEEHGIYKNLK